MTPRSEGYAVFRNGRSAVALRESLSGQHEARGTPPTGRGANTNSWTQPRRLRKRLGKSRSEDPNIYPIW